MKTPTLSTIYLDNQRIGLMGDPLPQVAKIVAASGKAPEGVRVLRGSDAGDTEGVPVRLQDTIDRTAHPETPIYLTCVKKDQPDPSSRTRATPSAPRPTITRTQFSDVGQDTQQRAPGPLPPLPDNQPHSLPDKQSPPPPPRSRRVKRSDESASEDPAGDDSPEWRL